MNDNLQNCIGQDLLDFAQFLASQSNADELKREFDKAYQMARYEAKQASKEKGRWMKISECPRMSDGR
jgi:hypothetical protein